MALTETEELEMLELERERAFTSTRGGAAVGNPNIQRQGGLAYRGDVGNIGESIGAIGGAGVAGAALGYASPELLNAVGGGIRMLPHPAAQTVGGALMSAGNLIRGSRGAAATSGAIAGAIGETAGIAAETLGAGPVTAEATRFLAGGTSAEAANLAKEFAKNVWARVPKLSLLGQAEKAMFKAVLEKLEGGAPQTLTDQERSFVEAQVAQLRGQGKTNAPLERIGSIMGAEGQRLLSSADQKMIAAQAQAAGIKPQGAQPELADIGESLQGTINTRYKGALEARAKAYTANEQLRDSIVAHREKAGQSIDKIPAYRTLIGSLKAELKAGLHSPDVAADFEHILNQITTKAKKTEQPFGGLGSDPFAVLSEKKPPVSFNQIDEVRRQLGEVFRGKPPEGYKAIDAATARKYYAQLSDLQEKYVGAPQRKLLDDYAQRTEGLEIFSSKYGKKSTALDQYREDTFANDPSSLPTAYFKTRASVQALKELTGSQAQVNNAALHYANKELAGKDSTAIRKWLSANSEWLAETGVTRRLIDNYASGLEAAERSMTNAQDFAKQAAKDSAMLTRQSLPAQRAVDLIKSGNTELWSVVTPVIARSSQARKQMVDAVRQVIADQATSKGTADMFARNIRPFLEGSGIAGKAEMDFIAQKFANIQTLNIPETEKLGLVKRVLLAATGGWAATAVGRGTAWSVNKMVPD